MQKKSWMRAGLAIGLCVTMVGTGCSTNWIGESEEIVAALIPAATNVVTLATTLEGKTISAADLQTIQTAGTQAGADLQLVQSLIAAYEKADASAQPGILNQIETAMTTVQSNLQNLLPALHIKDAATQAKITAVVGLVVSEVQSLAAIVPIVKAGASPALAGTRIGRPAAASGVGRQASGSSAAVPLSADEFVSSYNATLAAKTGNADVDRATAGLKIHAHGKVERWATAGWLK
jgi:hypothetical protein